MEDNKGAHSGPWRIEPGRVVGPDGIDDIVGVFHERNDPIYVDHSELPDLIGALMLFLDIEKIEAS